MKKPFIPYGRQFIDQDDLDHVCEVLQSDFITCGPVAEEFEQKFAKLVGAKHAVVVNSATSALHLALQVAGIGKGDRVITSPNTFLSSANCATFLGATPDFADIDPNTYTLCPKALEDNWTPDVKAVIPVAYAGQTADMPAIAKVARDRGAVIIEDASHGTGGGFTIDEQLHLIGGHPWADMTVFSFHPVKTLTTGEGGILVTNNSQYAEQAVHLRSHGTTKKEASYEGLGSDDPALSEQGTWYYEMQQLGYNYRITDIQCALGLSQLKKLPFFIERRREIVARYNEAFAELDWLKTPQVHNEEDRQHISWHLYTVLIDFKRLGKTRTEIMAELMEKGVGSQVHYIPVYLQPYYRKTYGYAAGKCPQAEAYYAKALSLPLFPRMTDEEVSQVIAGIQSLTPS